MRRREFLVHWGQAALGGALASLPGCTLPRAGARASATGRSTPAGDLMRHLLCRVPEWMREASVPGVGMALIAEGRIAWRGAFGVKDAASRAPVDAATMFEAASMSKPVFAYLVMKLCETGVMNLDTPLTECLVVMTNAEGGTTPLRNVIMDAETQRFLGAS